MFNNEYSIFCKKRCKGSTFLLIGKVKSVKIAQTWLKRAQFGYFVQLKIWFSRRLFVTLHPEKQTL